MKKHRFIAMLLCVCMMASTFPQVWAMDNEVTYEPSNDEIEIPIEQEIIGDDIPDPEEDENNISPTSMSLLSTADYSGTCGANATWELDTTTGMLTISGSGDMYDYSYTSTSPAPWYSCRSYIKTIAISHGITSIGYAAFRDCINLTNITIPTSTTSIGSRAFNFCTSLTNITIPDSVTSIGGSTFLQCINLTSITIPNSVTSIGISAFQDCRSLTSITIPNSVTSIGNDVFRDCKSLTSITIPDSVTSIGSSAFNFCRSLTSITIPDSVTSIGDYAFYYCTSLTSITIPNSVTSIGSTAFRNCSSLTTITVSSENQHYSSDEYGVLYNKNKTILMQYPIGNTQAMYTVPVGVTSIGDYAFSDCRSLTSITIPDSVTSIGSYTFSDCSSLTSMVIPDSVTSIYASAFRYCSNLTSIVIGRNARTIGNYAFSNCSNLVDAYFTGDAPTSFGYSVFDNTASGFTIYYIESKSGWTSPTWKGYPTATFSPSDSIPSEAVYYNGSYYMLYEITSGATGSNAWNEAKAQCDSLGGHLAVISSQGENDFLYSYIKSLNCDTAYFGYTDEETEGIWKWVTNEINTYTNWHSGEPNSENANEDYASFYWKYTDGTWNDGNFSSGTISDKKYYICEWETNVPPTQITTTFDTSEITLQIGETFDFVGSASQVNGNLKIAHVIIVKLDENGKEVEGLNYFRDETLSGTTYDLANIPSFTAGDTLQGLYQESLTLEAGKYAVKMWINNDQGETSGEIRKVINVIETSPHPLAGYMFILEGYESWNTPPYIFFDNEATGEICIVDFDGSDSISSFNYILEDDIVILTPVTSNFNGYMTSVTLKLLTDNQLQLVSSKPDSQVSYFGITNVGDVYIKQSTKPTVTGLEENYMIKPWSFLILDGTVVAKGNATLTTVTLKHYEENSFSKSISVNGTSNSVDLSDFGILTTGDLSKNDYPLNKAGTYDFVLYASASNFKVAQNDIFKFKITIEDYINQIYRTDGGTITNGYLISATVNDSIGLGLKGDLAINDQYDKISSITWSALFPDRVKITPISPNLNYPNIPMECKLSELKEGNNEITATIKYKDGTSLEYAVTLSIGWQSPLKSLIVTHDSYYTSISNSGVISMPQSEIIVLGFDSNVEKSEIYPLIESITWTTSNNSNLQKSEWPLAQYPNAPLKCQFMANKTGTYTVTASVKYKNNATDNFQVTVKVNEKETSANNISPQGLRLLINLEGGDKYIYDGLYYLYDDDNDYTNGWQRPTIGHGILINDKLLKELSGGRYTTITDLPVIGTTKEAIIKNAGVTITQDKAAELFREKIQKFEEDLNIFLKKYNITLNSHEFDAMVIFYFNNGSLSKNTRLFKVLSGKTGLKNEPIDEKTVKEAFTTFCLSDTTNEKGIVEKKPWPGLVKRRLIEANIFLYDYKNGSTNPEDYYLANEIEYYANVKAEKVDNPSIYLKNGSTIPSDESSESLLHWPTISGKNFQNNTLEDGCYHDIPLDIDTKIYAIADGTITYKHAYYYDEKDNKILFSLGKFIQFTSIDGKITAKYAHLNGFNADISNEILSDQTNAVGESGLETLRQTKIDIGVIKSDDESRYVKKKDDNLLTIEVKKGDIIGFSGKTGNVEGKNGLHLHFELYINEDRKDPKTYEGWDKSTK